MTDRFGGVPIETSSLVDIGRHYARAPIAEAIIELRCVNRPGLQSQDLAGLGEGRAEFLPPEAQFEVASSLVVSADGVQGESHGSPVGFMFRRQDHARVVTALTARFAYSWLRPYEDWSAFVGEAEAEWARYRELAGVREVTRVGVRFINQIDIPRPSIEIRDYLRTTADVSNYLPQAIAGYFVQVVVPLATYECMSQITSATLPGEPDSTRLVLDIDTWADVALSVGSSSFSESISEILARLHDAKNYVFEASITDATRGLID